MERITFAWPNGKKTAFTTSWDDGTIHDRRLVALLNEHGLKGTFNLNSGKLDTDESASGFFPFIGAAEVKELYAGHEVAVHSVTHPWLEQCPDDVIRSEILLDRQRLESLVNYPVRGMALPYGTYDDRVLRIARESGILYCRPVMPMPRFDHPRDFMRWYPTVHHRHDVLEHLDRCIHNGRVDNLFYLWGHSYEFAQDDNWPLLEEICGYAGAEDSLWHATNRQIFDYVTAWHTLEFSINLDSVRNVSAVTLWFSVAGTLRSIKPGEVQTL